MSAFKALNLESDDESDVEIDNTKELQIEDALKLYQNALKYHAEGPGSYSEAAQAYKELFESEIFKYPESQSELRRIELYGPSVEQDQWLDLPVGNFVAPLLPGENAPSTLPQIIHLAHKNYGDFILDSLKHRARRTSHEQVTLGWTDIRDAATSALDHFVEALDKDESDNDVWRQSSTIGTILNSRRIARFCLEAILEGEDDALNDLLAFPGFDQSAAAQDLLDIVRQLHDTLSLLHGPLSDSKSQHLVQVLRRRFESLEDVDDVSGLVYPQSSLQQIRDVESQKLLTLHAPSTWNELVKTLVDSDRDLQSSLAKDYAVGILKFSYQVSASSSTEDDNEMMVDAVEFHFPANDDIGSCFPGLDNGKPSVPRPAWGELSQMKAMIKDWQTPSLPTRKRSSDIAALEPDTGPKKSKRLRARESLAEGLPIAEDGIASVKKPKKDPFEETEYNDSWSFSSTDEILRKLGIEVFGELATARPNRALGASDITHSTPVAIVSSCLDMFRLVSETPEAMPRLTLSKADRLDTDSNFMHLISALEADTTTQVKQPAKPALDASGGLESFLSGLNSSSLTASEAAFALIQVLFRPNSGIVQPALDSSESSYTGHSWPDKLSVSLRSLLIAFDGYVCSNVTQIMEAQALGGQHPDNNISLPSTSEMAQMIEGIFEMHLEVLSQVKYSEPEDRICSLDGQQARTERWSELARDAVKLRQEVESDAIELADHLNLRYVWAAAAQMKMADKVDQGRVLACLQELRAIFAALSGPVITLPNNSLMPVLSLGAIDRQIAKLTTSDFFSKVFGSDSGDSVAIIEGLEPLLEYVHLKRLGSTTAREQPQDDDSEMADVASLTPEGSLPAPKELIDFLCSCSSSVIIALWQRLRMAYQNIEYIPMIAVCHFRMVEVIVSDVRSPAFQDQDAEERQVSLLKHIKQVHESLMKVLDMTKISTLVFDCMDLDRIRTTTTALVEVLKILQFANFAQDEVRLGEKPAPFDKDGSKAKTFRTTTALLNDAQLSAWITLYLSFQEAAKELPDVFPNKDFDGFRMEMLRSVHTSVGGRGFCEGCNRILLNLLKKELPTLKHVAGYDFEFSQVLLDLYDLNCFVNPSWEILPHDCSREVSLDRAAAVQAVDLLLMQVSKIKLADLYKHSLKDAFERVHIVVARKKASEGILRNRDIYTQFFRSPINPIDLYRCLKGNGEINLVTLPDHLAALSNKGWYFVMGYLCLSRFRSQKRNPNTGAEDVDTAISFFTQDLEYNSEKWETWFRLGQAFDSKLEDSVTWTADKLNNNMGDIAQLQRSVIHCYRMATALATRITDPQFESSAAVAELYADFANRMYASSRSPFNMHAFSLQGATRFLSTHTLIKVPAFKPLTEYTAWKFAKTLYSRAIAGNPEHWTLHYMLGKCLWKMHNATPQQAGMRERPYHDLALHAFQRAIELLPRERRDKKEPLLEPHYKIVTVVHKLMTRKDSDGRPVTRPFDLHAACNVIRTTPYARKVNPCTDFDDWEDYVLNVLKQLRNADKANWHHRMIARSARIVYGTNGFEYAAALGAKHELTQQLFTKTMVLQVWRPELERAGRHFVYTVQYTRFFMEILEGLNEKVLMEALARRVRKRTGDFFKHTELWQDMFVVYVRMMRRHGKVPLGQETTTFSGIEHSDFLKRKDVLEKWCQEQDSKDLALDTLRDALEFKKVNSNLAKSGQLDDLIGDTFAYLFDTKGKELWAEHQAQQKAQKDAQALAETRTMMNLTNFISSGPNNPPVQTPAAGAADTPGEHNTPVKRKLGVGRREIRLCAEACVSKFAAQSAAEPDFARREPQIVITRRSSHVSPTGSLHDSADDESELSEVDEDVVNQGSPTPRVSMFPNLTKGDQLDGGNETADGEADDEDQDEHGEGDDEDNGGEDEEGDEEDGEENQDDAEMEDEEQEGEHGGGRDEGTMEIDLPGLVQAAGRE
ncbi:hypothetical protein B9Z65_4744 [Elsinoe australis]|uniref:Histone transcription regulator 3 homolog n=1 Tax=Elsinoe australis TaxID=40998 RepID=A0A2P8A5X9_9PEZI|nr:hypothetical protein B9Z65_4744 [Elsinoe australis]